ncbi:thioredoxin reductase (NADPH) [Methylophilaceae bacterium]|nr:thioredoxin reductase (NADPH) [Methylophilaceae bacterium]
MLEANIKQQLQSYFDNLTQKVEITAYLDESDKSREMRELLQDIAGISANISLAERRDAAERTPSFKLNRPGGNIGIQFAGIPMGHEFTSLVLALLQVGGHPPKVSEDILQQIRDLEGTFHFETYISLSCQNCPEVVQALNLLSVVNPNITHVMIDGALYQDEVTDKQIMAVPTIYMNGQQFGQGRMNVDEILARLDTRSIAREAEKINARDPFDILVIGGGPAGSSAAVYAARKGIRTGLVAERFGGQVMDTNAIENFISVKETEGPKLVAALEEHVKSYDVDIMNTQRAKKLIPGELIEVELASGARLKSKAVIISTGARWRELDVPGEKEYRGKGVAYCPHCDGPLFKGKPVAVVGGGNSGVEAAIDLAGFVSHVTLLQFDEQLKADAVLQNKLFSLPNVEVITQAQTSEVNGDGNKVNGLTYIDRATGSSHKLDIDAVFVQIGLIPNTDWLEGTVELSKYGEIEVDSHGQTSVPGVFAAGDVTTIPYKQIVIALGDGARASLGAFDYLIRQ